MGQPAKQDLPGPTGDTPPRPRLARALRPLVRLATIGVNLAVIGALLILAACSSTPEDDAKARSARSEGVAAEYNQANVLPPEQATVVAYPDKEEEIDDPLIGFNRAMFAFNDVSYRYVMIPIAKAYNHTLPQPVRSGVSNFFANIKSPISIVNHLLQGEGSKAGNTSLRFLINTTVGIVGIFDPAEDWWEIEEDNTGFADTLERHGTGQGVFVVLPFLGPSDLRGSTGLVADYFLNPIPYLTEQPDTAIIMATDAMQNFSDKAEAYEKIRAEAEDPYVFFRNMYLQGKQRDKQFPAIGTRKKGDSAGRDDTEHTPREVAQ